MECDALAIRKPSRIAVHVFAAIQRRDRAGLSIDQVQVGISGAGAFTYEVTTVRMPVRVFEVIGIRIRERCCEEAEACDDDNIRS